MRGRLLVGTLAAAVIAVVGSAAVAVGAIDGGANHDGSSPFSSSPAVPKLPGTLVNVSLSDMGGQMMGQRLGMMSGGGMGLSANQATIPLEPCRFL